MADTAQKDMEVKPPPFHECGNVFEEIAALYNGGNNLLSVQDEFRGALKVVNKRAVPKEHTALAASIATSAALIDLVDDPLLKETLKWIESERARHPEKFFKVGAADKNPNLKGTIGDSVLDSH